MDEQSRQQALEAASVLRAMASGYRAAGSPEWAHWIGSIAEAVAIEARGGRAEWAGIAASLRKQ